MKSDSQLEAQIKKNELAMQELTIRLEALDRDVEGLLNELKISPEQLTTFIENKDNFTEENWNSIQEQRKSLDEKLLRELLNVSNPNKTRDAFKKMVVQPNWLFVR